MALNPLDYIKKYESGNRNVHQNIVPAGGGFNPSTGTVTGPSSASGFFQITNSTWRGISGKAGVDTAQYPTAMSAPYDVQERAATALYNEQGFKPWAPYNANLRSAISSEGGQGAFVSPGSLTPSNNPTNDPYINHDEGIYTVPAAGNDQPPMTLNHIGGTSQTLGASGGSGGSGDVSMNYGRKSKDMIEAEDRMRASERTTASDNTKSITETNKQISKDELTQQKSMYDETKAGATDYFARAIFIIVGLLFLWGGLKMFGVPVPGPLDVIPAGRALRAAKAAAA